jgi:hypothetical protein
MTHDPSVQIYLIPASRLNSPYWVRSTTPTGDVGSLINKNSIEYQQAGVSIVLDRTTCEAGR